MLFSEHHSITKERKTGSIEVVCGSMFSGKTEELIRRLRRAEIARLKFQIFKPDVDDRYHAAKVVSHNQESVDSTSVTHSSAILLLENSVQVVGIDEAQFFDQGLINVCNILANKGVRVIVAGLDMDYKGQPFGPMPNLMAIAEHVTKVHAVCVCCGAPAAYTFRISPESEQVLLGEKESYEPRCRKCYQLSMPYG